MKTFYVLLVVIGLAMVAFGGFYTYTGIQAYTNAQEWAEEAYEQENGAFSRLEKLALHGISVEADTAYVKLKKTEALEDEYKEVGLLRLVVFIPITLIGLLMVAFGRGKMKTSPAEVVKDGT